MVPLFLLLLPQGQSEYGIEQYRPGGQAPRRQLKYLSRNKAKIMQGTDSCEAMRKLNHLGESKQMENRDVESDMLRCLFCNSPQPQIVSFYSEPRDLTRTDKGISYRR